MISQHDHATNMVWDDDYCACKVCGTAWILDLKKGWIMVDGDENPIPLPKPQLAHFKPRAKKKVLAKK